MSDSANEIVAIAKTRSEKDFEMISRWVPRLAIGISIGLLLVYFSVFHNGFGGNNEFGTFGDFIGGTLNPLLTFGTVLLLIYSIRFQLEELRETREEIKRSREDIKDSNKINAHRNSMELEIFQVERVCEELKSANDLLSELYSLEIFSNKHDGTVLLSDILIKPKHMNTILGRKELFELFQTCIGDLTELSKILSELGSTISSKKLKHELFKVQSSAIVKKLNAARSTFCFEIKNTHYYPQINTDQKKIFEDFSESIDVLNKMFPFIVLISHSPD